VAKFPWFLPLLVAQPTPSVLLKDKNKERYGCVRPYSVNGGSEGLVGRTGETHTNLLYAENHKGKIRLPVTGR
jgi:hypothetical protein